MSRPMIPMSPVRITQSALPVSVGTVTGPGVLFPGAAFGPRVSGETGGTTPDLAATFATTDGWGPKVTDNSPHVSVPELFPVKSIARLNDQPSEVESVTVPAKEYTPRAGFRLRSAIFSRSQLI